jgi:hypothetical protein
MKGVLLMKKALATILLAIVLSAGFVFPADIGVSAETQPVISDLAFDGSTLSFHIDRSAGTAVVEYSFSANDMIMSRLVNVEIIDGSGSIDLEEEILAIRIWRFVTDEGDYCTISSVTGTTTLAMSSGASIDDVEVRLKTLYISDDLITKELTWSDFAAIQNYLYTMHFSLVDEEGASVPIDRIYALDVEYDVITTWFGIASTEHVVKEIQATETRSMTLWPYVWPATVIDNIQESDWTGDEGDFDWMVNLGVYEQTWPLSSVTLDQTTLLTIDYFYEGIFYEDVTIVDEPYDEEDVVDTTPGGTVAADTSFLEKVWEWITENPTTAIAIVVGVVVFVLLARFLSALKAVLEFIGWIIKSLAKAVGFVLKGIFLVIYHVLRLFLYLIPKGILAFLAFLITPAEKRRQRAARKDMIDYAGRSL